jgi:hypothetical protein
VWRADTRRTQDELRAHERPSARRSPLVRGGEYRHGYPTKLLIAAKPRGRTRRVVLRGWRCSDRLPLRFWYRNANLPFSGQVTDSELASTGDLGLKVRLRDMRRQRWQMTGYLMFSSPGTWIVKAYVGSRAVGSVVFAWS